MERFTLNAVVRNSKGRQVRREKLVPAVLYGRGIEPSSLAVPEADINHFINHGSANALIDMAVGSESYTVMIKDLHRNKVKGNILHVDFYAVDLKQEITTAVVIHLQGEAEGVKAGGVLQHQTREIEVKCLPTAIPESFDVDISALNIGETLTVADLKVPQGVEVLSADTEVIVSVLAPRLTEEDETETEETAEAPEQEPDAE